MVAAPIACSWFPTKPTRIVGIGQFTADKGVILVSLSI